MMNASNLVVLQAALLQPQASITIAVDTAYVASKGGQNISNGIYMMDNQVSYGSTGEGTLELSTVVPVGSLIGFNTVPIDTNSGDTVIITGFTVSQGSVFGSQGYPQQQPPINGEPAGAYWIGQAINAGSQTYQIQIKVTVGQLRPISYYINWDPFITAK
ncbi:AidA/PixA family protein [Sphingomonas glacialis]|jgi:hypothetical protein|uniref:Uncharacterized protein n=1 Tax=Sphingomonas glacialis TaxID=658225 RepID=A0A502FZ59_9SPHN|nr:AidA/PixA family protein [Sphingomonas glacialis]TPG54326.1 hypothetical protein EAH76_06540 [Sphingomonas glacialis]